MIKLPSVFSDGALFQHNAVLAIRGHASAGVRAAAAVIKNGTAVSSAEADCGSDGRFEITVRTPAASFDTYSITISAGDDTVTLGNIMFGELWLASGQSNMELTNIFMTDCDEYLAALGGYKLRYFAQEYGDGTVFPYDGSDELGGRWSDSSDTAAMRQISAAGTAFMKQIYEYLNRCGDRIPVGILNASWGGTPIGGWIPRDELLADDEIRAVLEKTGRVPSPDNWNSYGDVNFQQMSAMYNRKIHPLLGVKIRGVIWYQGENDCGGEHVLNVYARYLRLYRSVYKKLFACDRDRFMMISSLLYPWPYGESGETCMGYVNNAFIECAAEEPEAFAFAPIADLSPVWGYHLNNHPIHPTNKYEVGRRLGMLAETGCYGREGQSAPATLRSCAADGRRLILTFDNTGTGLRVEGRKARGLYICGADGIYLPAEYEIIAPDTLAVSYPFIEKPVHAAYAFNSFEPGCNLYAGDYPVAPFKTDWSRFIKIEAKPWMNMENDAVWVNSMRGDVLDMFYHSIWQPCSDSEICFDTAFTLEGRSLRIYSDNAGFGVSVKSYYGNRLALSDFAALRFNLLNCRGLSVSLICETGDREIEIEASRLHDVRGGWSTWEARLDALAGAEAGRMTFRFRHENNPYTFVNMESLYLVPKKLS
jgi:sialate O-acetylesterase